MDASGLLVILMFLTFIALLFTGYPIGFVLGGVAVIFTLVGYLSDIYLGTLTGLNYTVFGMSVNRLYKLVDNWTMVAIPMFIFMGLMLDNSGIAEKLLDCMQKMLGRCPGGLAISVTIIGIVLAASTGIVGASVILLGLLTLPIMLKQGYDKPLAVGTICAAGTLGILIPPSIMLVVMADQLGLSAGDLFMGAFIPGFILCSIYIVYLLIYSFLYPHKAPLPKEIAAFDKKLVVDLLKSFLAPAALIFSVLGSIFFGICTPTEASGIGAIGATVLAAINKRLTFKSLGKVLTGTYATVGYIFGIFLGATCFALVLRMLGGDEFIGGFLSGLPLGPYGILSVIIGIVFILGFFLDWIEITLIILPLITPVVTALNLGIEGFGVVSKPDIVWFAIVIAVTLQTSFLTPPVGFAIFYLKGVCPPEVKLIHIYRGIIPFVILQCIGIAAVVIWPELVTWLPAVAYR